MVFKKLNLTNGLAQNIDQAQQSRKMIAMFNSHHLENSWEKYSFVDFPNVLRTRIFILVHGCL